MVRCVVPPVAATARAGSRTSALAGLMGKYGGEPPEHRKSIDFDDETFPAVRLREPWRRRRSPDGAHWIAPRPRDEPRRGASQ